MITENRIDTSPAPRISSMDVAPDVAGLQIVMVNVYFVGDPSGQWALVDAGLPFSAGRIASAAEERFGADRPPSAIILTHGHFDHVGALKELTEKWNVPIYAHRLEMPYLTGASEYPPPDPTVGGGLMARMSWLYPKHPNDFRPHIRELPADGTVPGMDGWRWIYTPGHSPGHVSLFRDSDRLLIAGDAFVTQKQESLLAVLSNTQHVHGPPMYFTPDWISAKHSVQKLAELSPAIAATGHGPPMGGEPLLSQLQALALHFEELGMPAHGRYVAQPAVMDESGVRTVPPPVPDPIPKLIAAAVIAVGTAALLTALSHRSRDRE